MEFLRHLRDAWLRLSAASHVTEHVGACPHCDERTTWTVRMLNGYVRCRQCGHSPLESSDAAAIEQQHETSPRVPA